MRNITKVNGHEDADNVKKAKAKEHGDVLRVVPVMALGKAIAQRISDEWPNKDEFPESAAILQDVLFRLLASIRSHGANWHRCKRSYAF